jgi:hypothetical protein
MNGVAANEKAVAVWQHAQWEKAKKVNRVDEERNRVQT